MMMITSMSAAGSVRKVGSDVRGMYDPREALKRRVIQPVLLHDRLERTAAVVMAERAWIAHAVPVDRLVQPGEVAAMAHYLLADESAMVTGQCLVIDGGASAGPALPLLDLALGADESDLA